MKTRLNKGFTLIELLVVIAIIGILSGIVLTSLGTARNKAKDASAQASMSSMRAQAELGVGASGNYLADLCTTAGTTQGGLSTLVTAVNAQIPTANAVTCVQNAAAGSAASGWAAVATLNTGVFFCVDSSGYAGTVSARTAIAGASAASADVSCQ